MEIRWIDRMKDIGSLYERLDNDEESIFILEQRLEYLISRDPIKFWNNIKVGRKWECPSKQDNFIIFGAGKVGKMYLDIIERGGGKNVVAFCDNYLCGGIEMGRRIMTVEQAVEKKLPIIIPDGGYFYEAKKQLMELGIESEYIIQEPDIRSYTGTQYFDVWMPRENEILVDCGSYDGDTIEQFIKWTDSDYGKIYAFEPDESNYENCLKYIRDKNIRDCELFNKGTWSSSQTLELLFAEFDTGSRILQDKNRNDDKKGVVKIEGISIDEALHGERATFIKMDVEGSEMESLKGAANTIRKYKPRLAVAVYHYFEDIFDIPRYILSLNNQYRFKLRHYSSGLCETVLYAE